MSTVTDLRLAYRGNPGHAPSHHLKLAAGNPSVPSFSCCLCGGRVATGQPHLEMLEVGQRDDEGMPTCTTCAAGTQNSWAIVIRQRLLSSMIEIRNRVLKISRQEFALDCDSIAGDLLCSFELAKMGSNGVALEPEAAEFLRKNGGAA